VVVVEVFEVVEDIVAIVVCVLENSTDRKFFQTLFLFWKKETPVCLDMTNTSTL
jgi:hypothetical protein